MWLVAFAWAMISASVSILVLRFWARTAFNAEAGGHHRYNFRRINASDWFMFLSLIFIIGHAICITGGVAEGLGRHATTLTESQLMQTKKWIAITKGFTIVPATLGRVSVGLDQGKYVKNTGRSKQRNAYIVVLSVVGLSTAFNLATVVQVYTECGKDFSAVWDPVVAATAHCQSMSIETNVGYGQSALNSLVDLLLSSFPLLIIFSLQLTRQQKTSLCLVLMVSYVAVAASVVKAVEIKELSSSTDITYNFVKLMIWVILEANIIILTGSLLSLPLRPLWSWITQQSSTFGPFSSSHAAMTMASTASGGITRKASVELTSLRRYSLSATGELDLEHHSAGSSQEDLVKSADDANPVRAAVHPVLLTHHAVIAGGR
ncbi:hypothetical protein AAFC00_000446 [Neodothiora populina]|uniref:Rhodopsin domain-containing protein n=1 Tax=Neodothiora populina TaxID=2781224 RepID=A0ABR3PCX6_9PEZI